MKFPYADLSKPTFIYGAVFLIANRMQTLGDKIDSAISTKQWFVLAAVSKFKEAPPNIGDIADLLGTSRQNIKKIADILERKGYLILKKDPSDLRNVLLFLTDSCYDYFKGREQQENDYMEKMFSGINDESQAALCYGLIKLIENIDKIMNESAEFRKAGK